jgi:UDP-N-acetyl-D-mannosaminuronic acid dehydrogenase
MQASVAVVGLGRIGLPLALTFADRGLHVVGVDKEPKVLESIAAGRMPFHETGTQEVLERVLPTGRLTFSQRIQDAAECDNIVLTLGTPAFSHIEIDISQIRGAIDELLPVLREGQSLLLRSTVAPRTTEWVAGYIEQRRGFTVGENLFVAHVPERIAENHFLEEIESLPHIVGGVGPGSAERASDLFRIFGSPIELTTPVQAELAKIWTNILRYTNFALPNLLMMNCEQYDANVFEVIDLINRDYPRGGIAAPGLTAGTCLRKDFTFSEERSSAPGMLLAVSRVHESVPLFLVEGLKRRLGGSLRDCKVAVLGLTFKRNSDDMRDSLAFKLVRLLERELAHVARHDPHAPVATEPLETALEGARAVVIATNHSEFEPVLTQVPRDALVVDPWNVTGSSQVFAFADELVAAPPASSDIAPTVADGDAPNVARR